MRSKETLRKSLSAVIMGIVGMVLGAVWVSFDKSTVIHDQKMLAKKHLDIMILFKKWIAFKQQGKSLVKYFEDNNYNSIAIYGMGHVGEMLAKELENSSIIIKYGIDQNAANISADFEMITPEDELENVDVVVVTAINFFDEIEEKLNSRIKCPIVSIEDIFDLV